MVKKWVCLICVLNVFCVSRVVFGWVMFWVSSMFFSVLVIVVVCVMLVFVSRNGIICSLLLVRLVLVWNGNGILLLVLVLKVSRCGFWLWFGVCICSFFRWWWIGQFGCSILVGLKWVLVKMKFSVFMLGISLVRLWLMWLVSLLVCLDDSVVWCGVLLLVSFNVSMLRVFMLWLGLFMVLWLVYYRVVVIFVFIMFVFLCRLCCRYFFYVRYFYV